MRSVPQRNDGRRDTATGALGETAAATASSQMHCSSHYCQVVESTFICHLHPPLALTLLSPSLFTHWRKRWVLGRQFTQKCLLFKNPPFLFFCSICMGKNRPPASIAGEVLKHWTDLLQPSWALHKAHPALHTSLKGVGGELHSECAVVSNCTALGILH